ncbi:MAG: hypothetical protein GX957_15195 [Clostridiaceae bacterium]|nr:hypothetical protein [Clostridiaceae bacterium]
MSKFECVRCHRFFDRMALEEVCPPCSILEEEEFKQIKEYLALHPGASSSELVSQLNVTLKSIKRYLKEERLEIIGDNKGFIRCELCGVSLNSGRFCPSCFREGNALRLKEAKMGLKSTATYSDYTGAKYQKGIKYGKKG